MKQLSERFKTDQALANLYSWNRYRQYGPEPTNANGGSLFCNTSCTETYQKNECEKNLYLPEGPSFHGLNGQIIGDWIIGNWVNIRD